MFLCIFSNTLEKTSTNLIYITKTSEKKILLPGCFNIVNC